MGTLELLPTGCFEMVGVKGRYAMCKIDTKTILYVPLVVINSCMKCKHFNNSNVKINSCKAFVRGIPKEILLGENDHTEPFEGDNGIQFEPIEEEKEK